MVIRIEEAEMSWSGQSWGPEQPRLVADLTGDGRADIVGFGLDGVWVSLNNGNGTFQPPNMVLCGFNFHTGWRVERHPRFLADLTGDGRADIIGFGDAGVWTARNNGDGTFQAMKFEHGGFYDHVPPVPAAKVSPEMLPTTGVRVPCFVISPWVKGGAVFGSDTLLFDHTSILKTIARRFMSNDPPYMGARYAAAHDLSEILDATIRPEQFRPFIPYNLTYVAAKMCLDVQAASTAAGAPLWQYTPNGTDAQEFRFEDAGGDFVYIRTLAGLYVTVNAPSGIHAGPGETLGIKQDLKYAPGSRGSRHPDLQRWKFASSTITAVGSATYTISCAAVPGKTLQPLDGSTASGTAVVLADPARHLPTVIPNPWTVTSPLLPSTTGVNA